MVRFEAKFWHMPVIVVGVLCLMVSGCYISSKIEYSDGYRDGVVEKCSKKGIFFKTAEGRMVLGGMQFVDGDGGGTLTARLFEFTCENDEVFRQIEALPSGARVRLHYRQKLTTWLPNGDTNYFVHKAEILQPDKK